MDKMFPEKNMNNEELVRRLKDDHVRLISELSLVLEKSKDKSAIDEEGIILTLNNFKVDLLRHLKVENELFYPDYLKKEEVKGENTSKTKEFIAEMDKIGAAVMSFLERYSMGAAVVENYSKFRLELSDITETLKMRTETEEDSVFDFYLLM